MTVFDIRPHDGSGPLRLGMSPSEVHAAIGEQPRSTLFNDKGERDEDYPALSACYSAGEDKLVELALTSAFDARFQCVSLFRLGIGGSACASRQVGAGSRHWFRPPMRTRLQVANTQSVHAFTSGSPVRINLHSPPNTLHRPKSCSVRLRAYWLMALSFLRVDETELRMMRPPIPATR